MPRVVILGCGTGVGKTRVGVALLRALSRYSRHSMGLKPVESGISEGGGSCPPSGSDADALARAGSLRTALRHPLHRFPEHLSPHLGARARDVEIDLSTLVNWVSLAEHNMAPLVLPHGVIWSIVETAGGVFSPLSTSASNFDLAMALEPATWILVAADALGVLHDVSATLQAMRALGRAPDHVVLSASREPDASTGSNASELHALGIATPSATLQRDDDRGIDALVRELLNDER